MKDHNRTMADWILQGSQGHLTSFSQTPSHRYLLFTYLPTSQTPSPYSHLHTFSSQTARHSFLSTLSSQPPYRQHSPHRQLSSHRQPFLFIHSILLTDSLLFSMVVSGAVRSYLSLFLFFAKRLIHHEVSASDLHWPQLFAKGIIYMFSYFMGKSSTGNLQETQHLVPNFTHHLPKYQPAYAYRGWLGKVEQV